MESKIRVEGCHYHYQIERYYRESVIGTMAVLI